MSNKSGIDMSDPFSFLKSMKLSHYETTNDFFTDFHDQLDTLGYKMFDQQTEIIKLKKALEVTNEALIKIDSSNDDMKYFNSEIDSILIEALKQIEEVMEGK